MAQYKFKISGKEYNVTVGGIEGKIAKVNVNGADYEVEMENAPETAPLAAPAPSAAAVLAAPAAAPSSPAPAPVSGGAGSKVVSPMEGKVLEICVKSGDTVKSGQKVVVIESMKMEVEISATKDGTVGEILIHKGDQLKDNQAVLTIV